MSTMNLGIGLSVVLAAAAATVGCHAPGAENDVAANVQHAEAADFEVEPIAGAASIQLGMVELRDEVIISEVAEAGPDDIKPGFEVELFAPSTLKPVEGVHGGAGLALRAGELAVVNFAPLAVLAQRTGGRQDAALYVESPIDPSGVYTLPTEYTSTVPYTGKPGVAVTEGVCDFSKLASEDSVPYPGLLAAAPLTDGKVHGGIVTMNASGAVKIRLVAQVEHCAKPITSAAQASAEPRLCYEKLVWLKANGKTSTELGRLSAYRARLSLAQTTYCGD